MQIKAADSKVCKKTAVWGIAGQIGSGKSTLGQFLTPFGAVNIEVDAIGCRQLDDSAIKAQLVQVFGNVIQNSDGAINRKELGHAAFQSQDTHTQLNAIMHPPMILAVKREVEEARAQGKRLCIINAALLYSMGLDSLCDLTIFLRAHPDIRLERIITLRGIPMESAKARLLAQDPEPKANPKLIVCENNGIVEDLKNWAIQALAPRIPRCRPGA